MKRFLMTIALLCAVSSSVLAGEIPSVGAPAPAGTDTTAPGDISTSGAPTTSTEPGEIPSGGFTGDIPSDGVSALLSVLSFLA